MSYAAQNDAIAVTFVLPLDIARLQRDFLVRHRELFGYATAEDCVIESVRVQARRPSATIVDRPTTVVRKLAACSRICSFEGAPDVRTQIVDRASMKDSVRWPAVLEDAWCSGWLTP